MYTTCINTLRSAWDCSWPHGTLLCRAGSRGPACACVSPPREIIALNEDCVAHRVFKSFTSINSLNAHSDPREALLPSRLGHVSRSAVQQLLPVALKRVSEGPGI